MEELFKEEIDEKTEHLIETFEKAGGEVDFIFLTIKKAGINDKYLLSQRAVVNAMTILARRLDEQYLVHLKLSKEERSKLSLMIEDYEKQLGELQQKKKKTLDEIKTKYKQELIQAKRSIEKMIKDLKKQGLKQESVRDMRVFFEEKLAVEEPREPYFPRVGEMVRIRELRKVGQVIEEHAGKYKVSLDNIYYWVEPKELEQVET